MRRKLRRFFYDRHGYPRPFPSLGVAIVSFLVGVALVRASSESVEGAYPQENAPASEVEKVDAAERDASAGAVASAEKPPEPQPTKAREEKSAKAAVASKAAERAGARPQAQPRSRSSGWNTSPIYVAMAPVGIAGLFLVRATVRSNARCVRR